jgi:hypothetical protein
MSVNFQLNFWDILNFNFYLLPRAKTYRFLLVFAAIALGYSGFLTASVPDLSSPLARVIAFLIPFVGGFIVIALLLILYFLAAYFLTPKDRIKNCKLTTTPEGIQLETSVSRSELKWQGVQKIRQTDRAIYLFISDTSAVVIPHRSFTERWQIEEFYNLVTDLWTKNKSMS